MSQFKVGDKVRRISGELDGMRIGHIATGAKLYPSGINIGLEELSGLYLTKNFEHVKEGEQMKKQVAETQWSFKTSHRHYTIDWDAISTSLTAKNPVALVTVDLDAEVPMYFAVFHESLVRKASTIGMMYPNRYYDFTILRDLEEFSEVIAWAKQVKDAEWPAYMRDKGTVNVLLPTI